jgi:pimeloyl-ACP methyl ester carboxylesterase
MPHRDVRPALLTALLAAALLLTACSQAPRTDLAAIYNEPAQKIGDERNPVVVIPGILGSKLNQHDAEGRQVWGAFVYGAVDADTPEGARIVALPMEEGVSLRELTDEVVPVDVLDTLELDTPLLRGLKIEAYVDILKTLAAGNYADQSLGRSGAVDYGGAHYTCFQLPYDWRRDISEASVALHEQILGAKQLTRLNRGLDSDEGLKVDVVAHSMGGLVLRYYLRYGPNPLPEDGSIPPLTWEGAQHVESAIIIGTPSAGSVLALRQLIEGVSYAPVAPTYRPAVLGTMPAVYQLMPRPRHNVVLDAQTGEPVDFLDIAAWERYQWGLLDPRQDKFLRQLLPEVDSREDRLRIARDQLRKCLAVTDQLFRALDSPASPPEGLELFLFAGDAVPTPAELTVSADGAVRISRRAPGDDTVTRQSALLDEREGAGYAPRLRTPIDWASVQFLPATHIGLTKDVQFTNHLLYLLLERPRDQ